MSSATYSIQHRLPGRLRVSLDLIRTHPNLARGIEALLKQIEGVFSARINWRLSMLIVSFDPSRFDLEGWLDELDAKLEERSVPELCEVRKQRGSLLELLARASMAVESILSPPVQFALGAASLVASAAKFSSAITGPLSLLSVVPIISRAIWSLSLDRKIGPDVLDSATCLICIRSGHYVHASLLTFLLGTGEFVRYAITESCNELVEQHINLMSSSVWKIKRHRRIRVSLKRIKVGDKVAVYPGESIAVSGLVLSGQATIVSSSPDEYSAPRQIKEGDLVEAGNVLLDGKIYLQVHRVESALESAGLIEEKRMTRKMQRTHLHHYALRTAHRGMPLLLALAGVSFAITRDIESFLSIITFDFVTGVKITVPVAVLAAIRRAGRRGIIFKNAAALERLATTDVAIFAKSGTLTLHEPEVTAIYTNSGFEEKEIIRLAGAVSRRYDHQQAYAIYRYARDNHLEIPERVDSSLIKGMGVCGLVEEREVCVGRTSLMQERGIDIEAARSFLQDCESRGDSRACIAVDGTLAGVIAYNDPVRPEAPEVVKALGKMGVEVIMITGGGEAAARAIAEKTGITDVRHRVSPEDAAEIVRAYRAKGLKVAFIGDDAKDARALEQANLSVTPSSGSDSAKFRADVLLVDGISGLTNGLLIARFAMRRARQDLLITTIPNVFGLTLSAAHRIDGATATAISNGSVLLGALNGIRPAAGVEEYKVIDLLKDDA